MSKVGYNPFAGLMHDDSSDSDSEEILQQKQIHAQPTAPNTPAQTKQNVEISPAFRVWNVSNEEPVKTTTPFSSPFSVKKKGKTKQIHVQDENDGWVSIRKNQPVFLDDSAESSDSEKEIKKEALMEALVELSALDGGVKTQPSVTATTGPPMRSLLNRGQNEMTAMDWAERVRVTLEKSEGQRRASSQASEDFVAGLGRLSFFRRADEK